MWKKNATNILNTLSTSVGLAQNGRLLKMATTHPAAMHAMRAFEHFFFDFHSKWRRLRELKEVIIPSGASTSLIY